MNAVDFIHRLDSKIKGDVRFEYDEFNGITKIVRNEHTHELYSSFDSLSYVYKQYISWHNPINFLIGDYNVFRLLKIIKYPINCDYVHSSVFTDLTTLNPWLLSLDGCSSMEELELKFSILGI